MRNFVFDKIPHILIDIEGNGKWGRSPNKASLAINALLVNGGNGDAPQTKQV